MSQENVDALHQMIEGVNTRTPAAIQAVCDANFELTSRFFDVEGKTYRSTSTTEYFADLDAVWEDLRLTIMELMPAGEEKLAVVLRVEGVGRGSGAQFDQHTYGAFEFRSGKALRGRFYASRAEALEAAGLSE
jgi:ketosteroid isomerase-like protein